jgi:hypothetical protein
LKISTSQIWKWRMDGKWTGNAFLLVQVPELTTMVSSVPIPVLYRYLYTKL